MTAAHNNNNTNNNEDTTMQNVQQIETEMALAEAIECPKIYKSRKKAIARKASILMKNLGFSKRYLSDGLTGRGMYWIHVESGIRVSYKPNSNAVDAMYAAKARNIL